MPILAKGAPANLPADDVRHVAAIAEVVDLGEVYNETYDKNQHKVLFVCQLSEDRVFTDATGKEFRSPFTVNFKFNNTTSPKGEIAKFLKKAFGITLTPDFDFETMQGRIFGAFVEHDEYMGRQYAKLSVVSPAKDTDESPLDLENYMPYREREKQWQNAENVVSGATGEDVDFGEMPA